MSYYDTLGVPRNAGPDDIKRAYRRLALKHHPDRGGDEAAFKTLQAAYDVLSSEEERRVYDQLGHESYIEHKAGGGGGGGGGPGHPFDMSDLFGGGFGGFFGGGGGHRGPPGPQQAAPVVHTLRCTLVDVLQGFRKTLNLNLEAPCLECQAPCTQCRGMGMVQRVSQMGPFTQISQAPCDGCSGRGQRRQTRADCSECRGAGCTRRNETLEVDLKPGFDNAARIVFAGKGTPPQKRGDAAGDLLIQMSVDESVGSWKRRGSDLVWTEPLVLTWHESVLGRRVTVPFIDGAAEVDTAMWGILKPDTEYRVRGRGLPGASSGARGDAVIMTRIDWPKTAEDIVSIRTALSMGRGAAQ